MSNDANPRLVLWTEGDFDPFHGIDVPMIEKAGGTLRLVKVRDEEERARLASDAAVLIAGWIPLPRTLLERMNRAVGVIRTGIGVDTVDLAAATELGICVANVPDFCQEEVAEPHMYFVSWGCSAGSRRPSYRRLMLLYSTNSVVPLLSPATQR